MGIFRAQLLAAVALLTAGSALTGIGAKLNAETPSVDGPPGEDIIALAFCTSYNHRLSLSRDDINRVSRFCDQIAGAIHHSNLLRANGSVEPMFHELRIGIHNGPAMAGIIGKHKFAYDVRGDAVNVASRMESNGAAGRVNISQDTHDIIKYFFDCEYRGKIQVKNRGELDMYFVNSIRVPLSVDGEGRVPNQKFQALYARLKAGHKMRFRSEVRN